MSVSTPFLAGRLPRPFSVTETELGYGPAWPLLGLTALVVLAVGGLNPFWEGQLVLMIVYALMISGVNLTFGFAGELALGQVAMFAVGSYLTAYLAVHTANDLLLVVIASMAAAAAVGLFSGLPGLRIGGWALAMTSFFLVILLPDLDQMFPGVTGGAQGFSGIPLPQLLGAEITPKELTLFAIAVFAGWFACFRNFVLSRHGNALKVLRESPHLASSMGIAVYRLKLLAYVAGAIPAGIAGALFAMQQGYVGPTTFSFALAVGIIAGAIIGGTNSIYGGIAGGALLEYINFRSASFAQYSLVVYGIVLLVGGVLTSRGLAGIARAVLDRLVDRLGPPSEPGADGRPGVEETNGRLAVPVAVAPTRDWRGDRLGDDGAGASSGPYGLHVRNVSKGFGGVQALRDVSLAAGPGEITAIIGPNGSGKTTLLNIIAGAYGCDAGSVTLDGRDLPTGRPHRVARAGVARTFQTPMIPRGIAAWEVVAAGRYQPVYCSVWRTVLRTRRFRAVRAEDRRLADALLDEIGLGSVRLQDAGGLPLPHRRILEVGRAMIRVPSVLLLDEPAAGLDEGDLQVLAACLRKLRESGVCVVLVEHNFSLVVELADVIHVLHLGEMVATGAPAAIQKDPTVVSIYLGTEPAQPDLPSAPASAS